MVCFSVCQTDRNQKEQHDKNNLVLDHKALYPYLNSLERMFALRQVTFAFSLFFVILTKADTVRKKLFLTDKKT